MATGRPLFPGSTVKEELHLIFRLLGQSPALPQYGHQGAQELHPAWAFKGAGKSCCSCSQQGEDPCGLGHSVPSTPTLHPSEAPLAIAPHHVLPTPLCLPRDPYRRDVAGSDGPAGVPLLQLPAVPPPAAHQPRSQVALPPTRPPLLVVLAVTPESGHTPRPATPPRPGLCQLLPSAGWTLMASTS